MPAMDLLVLHRPQNRWTTKQRLFLCCLVRFFKKDNHAFSKIFSCSFETELRQSGYQDGIAWTTLHSQWDTMRRSGDYLWGTVHLSPFIKEGDGSWYPIIRKIKQIAQHLNLDLVEKDEDDIDTSVYRARPPKNSGDHDRITAPEPVGHTAQVETEQQPEQQPGSDETHRSDENQEVPILVTAGGKICLFCAHEGNMLPDLQSTTEEIPTLLYRWSNVDSQGVNSRRLFQAGLFAEGTEYVHPHELPQGVFNQYIENHVRIKKTLSPFISTFRIMLAPIHRALRNEEGAIVSILDQKKLETPVYSAHTLIKTLNLRFSWYNGAAEYLIWGSIPKSAIVCSFKASTLLRIAKENPEVEELLQLERIKSFPRCGKPLHRELAKGPGSLDHETGVTIGKFLFQLEVPYEHCKTVSYSMYCSWRMKRRGSVEEFYGGVEEGYYSLNQHLTPSPVMGNSEIPDDMSEISEVSELPDNAQISEAAEIANISEDFEMIDRMSETSEMSEFFEFLDNAQIAEAAEMSNISENLEMPEQPVSPRTRQFSAMSDMSDISNISDIFNIKGPGVLETADYQTDEETVTDDDPRTSIDLFSEAGSPRRSVSAVIKLFDGATKQWIAQQENNNTDLSSCGPPGSSAQTAISLDSDDEFDDVFGQCKNESSVPSSSPPALDLEIIPEETIVNFIKNEEKNDPPVVSHGSAPATSTPLDRFAADRARVLHFWG